MRVESFILALLCGSILIPAASDALADEPLGIWAAASLTDVLREVGHSYERNTGQRLAFNFAGSSTLARQIEAGAPADVFFSADEAKMDRLEKLGLIRPETRVSRISNQLVLVVNADRPAPIKTPRDLIHREIERVALAQPRAVPAGIYAKAYLEEKNLWPDIAGKVVPTQNVRAALAAVESGNADTAFVYKTDAAISDKVRVVHEVPVVEGPTISYPAAVLKETRHPEAAAKFLDYLGTAQVVGVFKKYGFIIRSPNAHP